MSDTTPDEHYELVMERQREAAAIYAPGSAQWKSAENNLRVALADLHHRTPDTFRRIHASVLTNDPIAAGNWIVPLSNGDYCGCLMFDGWTKTNTLDPATKRRIDDEDDAFEVLAEFYDVDPALLVDIDLPNPYDAWTSFRSETGQWRRYSEAGIFVGRPEQYGNLITPEARRELRVIFEEVKNGRR